MGLLQLLNSFRAPASERVTPAASSGGVSHLVPQAPAAQQSGLTYPPRDPGIPLESADVCMAHQAELIRRLKVHAAQPATKFEQRFVLPMNNVAAYISSLPACSDGNFGGPGGLFRASVELGFAAFQASDGRIFSITAGVEERHLLEIRWRYVCFLAGLLWPLGKTLEVIKVTSGDGAQWTPRLHGVSAWAESSGASNVYCAWPRSDVNPGPAMTGASLAISLIGSDNIRWLEEGAPLLVTALVGIAGGQREERYGTAFDVVSEMWKRVGTIEAARRPQAYGRLQFGSHLGPHLVDVMHGLLKSAKWSIGRSPVFADGKGIYLQWPQAASDMLDHCREIGLSGMPSSSAGLLAALEDASLIVSEPGAASVLVEIADDDGELCSGVKLSRPAMLDHDYEPAKFAGRRMILVSDLVKADPLAQAVKVAEPKSAASTSTQRVPPPPGPDLLAPTLGAEAEVVLPPAIVTPQPTAAVTVAESPPPPPPVASVAPTAQPAEADEMSYYERVPDIWRNQVKRREGEVLGRLIELWNTQAPSEEMCVQKEGCAIALTVLTDLTSRHTDFLQEVHRIGMLHVNPSTPGRLVYDIVTSEGSKKKNFFIIASYASKQLGLKL